MKRLLKIGLALGLAVAMADVAVDVQRGSPAGVKPTDKGELKTEDTYLLKNDGKTVLRINNTGESATEVTVVTPNEAAGGLAIADRVVEVPAEEERIIGPFDPGVYNNADKQIAVKFSAVTGVTLAAVKIA